MPGKYATPDVRKNMTNRLKAMEECERNPTAWGKIQDKGAFQQEKARIEKVVAETTPPEVSPEVREKLVRRLGQLEDALVKGREGVVPPMTSRYEEEKCPAGVIGRGIIHDKFWKTHTLDEDGNVKAVDNKKGGRGAKFEWKDLRRIVYKSYEDDDPDIANLEILRPDGRQAPLADQSLPVTYGFTTRAKQNYDQAFPDHDPTPVEAKIAAATEQSAEDLRRARNRVTESSRRGRRAGPQCQAIRKNGERCDGVCLPGKDHCWIRGHMKQVEELKRIEGERILAAKAELDAARAGEAQST